MAKPHTSIIRSMRHVEKDYIILFSDGQDCAVFHIVSATLAGMGHARIKHSGVEAAFHQYLIGSGLLEKEHGVTYKLARKLREDADYGIDKVITEEIARDILEQCERLAKHVEQYLYKSGLIPRKQDT